MSMWCLLTDCGDGDDCTSFTAETVGYRWKAYCVPWRRLHGDGDRTGITVKVMLVLRDESEDGGWLMVVMT
ncbi:hypothetical protein L1987_42504 [Smallanthus sonchifolius]|uniref:Uncharacterized protein n=1 Tax=Smallanthus sonchifolius TaxID=185202 RepID=A0ACB9GK51_9ASTR|nr:hypothetical protein L1987_42504 [Smallanthus sonchifolius]